jgi:hypothetical protein
MCIAGSFEQFSDFVFSREQFQQDGSDKQEHADEPVERELHFTAPGETFVDMQPNISGIYDLIPSEIYK